MKKETVDTDIKPKPKPPQTMKELLDGAHKDWKFKQKDEAFMKVLNALALMAEGVAQTMRENEQLKQKLERYEQRHVTPDTSPNPVV